MKSGETNEKIIEALAVVEALLYHRLDNLHDKNYDELQIIHDEICHHMYVLQRINETR